MSDAPSKKHEGLTWGASVLSHPQDQRLAGWSGTVIEDNSLSERRYRASLIFFFIENVYRKTPYVSVL